MSLSLLLLILIPLFLIPAIFLPQNRLKYYSACSLVAFGVIFFICLFDVLISQIDIEDDIGKAFYGMFKPLIERSQLSQKEIDHLSFWLTLLFFYGLLYLLSYLGMKFFFIGSNPSIKKPSRRIAKVTLSLLFFLSTYMALAIFLVEAREILPFRDGFLSFLFTWIHPIQA